MKLRGFKPRYNYGHHWTNKIVIIRQLAERKKNSFYTLEEIKKYSKCVDICERSTNPAEKFKFRISFGWVPKLFAWLWVLFYRSYPFAILVMFYLMRKRNGIIYTVKSCPLTFLVSMIFWPLGILVYSHELASLVLAETQFRQTTGNLYKMLKPEEEQIVRQMAVQIARQEEYEICLQLICTITSYGTFLALLGTVCVRCAGALEKIVIDEDLFEGNQIVTDCGFSNFFQTIRAGPLENDQDDQEKWYLSDFLHPVISLGTVLIVLWLIVLQRLIIPSVDLRRDDQVPRLTGYSLCLA